ncbi:DUF2783 domain-containing protein [uncultured Psychrobacter sp.]|uniref:DUF2783 domain-containing protein n=1 Tax=uncultured Psychrobacter sp. TaxID=259303 RepID=UPI00345882E0
MPTDTYSKLNLSPNIDDPDTFYAELINMQVGLSEEEAQSALSKLLLILANQIGDDEVLLEAIETAREHTLDQKQS